MNRWRECFFIVHSHCSRRARSKSTLSPIFLSLWTPIVQGYRMHRYLFIFSTDKWKGNFQWIFIPSYRFRLRICGFGWPIDVVYPHKTPRNATKNEWMDGYLYLYSMLFVVVQFVFCTATGTLLKYYVCIYDAESIHRCGRKIVGCFRFCKMKRQFLLQT